MGYKGLLTKGSGAGGKRHPFGGRSKRVPVQGEVTKRSFFQVQPRLETKSRGHPFRGYFTRLQTKGSAGGRREHPFGGGGGALQKAPNKGFRKGLLGHGSGGGVAKGIRFGALQRAAQKGSQHRASVWGRYKSLLEVVQAGEVVRASVWGALHKVPTKGSGSVAKGIHLKGYKG